MVYANLCFCIYIIQGTLAFNDKKIFKETASVVLFLFSSPLISPLSISLLNIPYRLLLHFYWGGIQRVIVKS